MRHPFFSALILVALCACASARATGKVSHIKIDASTCTTIALDDGDSFSCNGEPIRVLGIDTPEIKHPQHGIFEDQEKGPEAAAMTERLLHEATRVVIVRGGTDPYGRTLAHVLIDGELLGVKLLKAGLAYETVRHFGDNGLPEYALAILEASKTAPKPAFEAPYKWRRKHQKR